jgi:hypothetical protein
MGVNSSEYPEVPFDLAVPSGPKRVALHEQEA